MRKLPRLLINTGLLLTMLVSVASSVLAREKVLYQFPGGTRGSNPQAGVVFDSSGNAYGTTYYGGEYGWGTIFRLEQSNGGWKQQILYSFLGTNDGFNPAGNLVIDAAGNLYGTTVNGGTGTGCQNQNYVCSGTVFELARSKGGWKHAVLYNFCSLSGCADGAGPEGLIFDKAGNLYGITFGGGQVCQGGCGTVYELSPSHGSWTQKVLFAFGTYGAGIYPTAGVTIDEAGRIYGTTYSGGGYGYGTVYILKRGKYQWKEVTIYAFDGSTNYKNPNGYLTLDSAGHIFGTTTGGTSGCSYQCGIVYKLSHSKGQWIEETVYTFDGTHGASPDPGLILTSTGSFYGSTLVGGNYNFGEVFELTPGKTWTINLIYSFTGQAADANPNGVTFGPGGGLYGTTPGGYYNSQYYGEVFEVFQ
jgi:uncharacterized repeat protein (TIGR03803 family)